MKPQDSFCIAFHHCMHCSVLPPVVCLHYWNMSVEESSLDACSMQCVACQAPTLLYVLYIHEYTLIPMHMPRLSCLLHIHAPAATEAYDPGANQWSADLVPPLPVPARGKHIACARARSISLTHSLSLSLYVCEVSCVLQSNKRC